MPPNPTEQPAFETLTDAERQEIDAMLPDPAKRGIGEWCDIRTSAGRVIRAMVVQGQYGNIWRMTRQKARKLKGGIE